MTTAEIDFEELFDAAPNPYLVPDADLVVRYANWAYLKITGRTAKNWPDGTSWRHSRTRLPHRTWRVISARDFGASLQRVLDSREPDVVAPQRFDIPVADRAGDVEERWWCGMSSPVLGPDGTVKWIIARADDVTEFMHSPVIHELTPPLSKQASGIAAQVYARSHDLEQLNEQLRQAHARETRSRRHPAGGHAPLPRPGQAQRHRRAVPACQRITQRVRRLVRRGRSAARPLLGRCRGRRRPRPAGPPSWACCAAH
ncbi:PAS domain-containing protein [Streptomyces sp. NPDC005728]|uniref:PAS domain-containing protein n=1 Tax=Streptomyces sp. NPDC005728 TaxID=3157054 RepID=UPI0033C158BC